MMNWSMIVLGLVALSSVTFAENSYIVIVPKLLKVGLDNQISVFIASASKPVEITFELTLGQQRILGKTICKAGETRNATITLPKEFPVGAGELTITGTGGLQFEDKRDIIVYDNSHVILVQTSASTYLPGETMELRVIATDENLIPMEDGELDVEIYDAALKLVGTFPRVPIRSGLTESLRFPIGEYVNVGSWLVSAIIGNTTSSVQVLITRPVTPSFDLKAIFQRYLLRTDTVLRGVIEIDSDRNTPIFGRAKVYIGKMTEQEVELKMKSGPSKEEPMKDEEPIKDEEYRRWKSQEFEMAGRVEINYDLLSLFDIDVSKVLAVQVYIEVTDLMSGQDRIIRHMIPVFAHNIMYDIRPLEFESGLKNEYEVVAKRPDGKPVKMEDIIVTVRMMMGDEHGKLKDEKTMEIRDFYTRGRNDVGFFNIEFPKNCMGVLMTITPVGEDGKARGYQSHTLPLMPTPPRRNATLSIELVPSKVAPVNTDVNVPVISSEIATVGRTSTFYVQLIPSKPIEKFEPLPMSYVLMTNGRIARTGEFRIEPTKACQGKTTREIKPEEQRPLECVFNGTLPIEITRDMVPYSTLFVYTFQPSLGFNVAESYRFSVAGLFQSSLSLNATIVPFTSTETIVEPSAHMKDMGMKPIRIPSKVQDKTRVELSFTGVPDSTVGLNVFEYDAVLQGLSNEITKERLLRYLTTYEQVPIMDMSPMSNDEETVRSRRQMGPNTGMGGMGGMGGQPSMGGMGGMGGQPSMGGMGGQPSMGGMGGMGGQSSMGGMDGQQPLRRTINEQDDEDQMRHERMNGQPPARRTISEQDEEDQMHRERMSYKVRYPVEKMVFGVSPDQVTPLLEGDDIYRSSYMGRLYGDANTQTPVSHYRRKLIKPVSQYDITVGDNDYVFATSVPLVFTAGPFPKPGGKPMPPKPHEKPMPSKPDGKPTPPKPEEGPMDQPPSEYGTPSWFEKVNTKLSVFTPEAFKLMQSGLTIVSDFDSLRFPKELKRENLSELFAKFRVQSNTFMDYQSFNLRDEARQLLEEYIVQSGLSMMVPPIMFEEQSRIGYYRSIFFNTSRIESQGTGKVVLPRTKPYSTWMATGFALNRKSGLSIAHPIRLPNNRGLYVVAECPKMVQVGEHALLSYGVTNYLGKDMTNIMFRIRASPDFDLMEQSKPDQIISSKDQDYKVTFPAIKYLAGETRNLIMVPKRTGVIQMVLEVESEFGGDYEVITMFVRESGIEKKNVTVRLFDLTSDKKTYGPFTQKFTQSSDRRAIHLAVSGTGLDRFVKKYTMETNSLIGIDRALVGLYRSLGLRRYLNETFQTDSPLFNMTADNITTAYQRLQLYSDYDGSYSFISDEGKKHSSLYLSSLAFGAMISPMMPFRDNVTLNRTLTYILSRQQEDGSFEDNGACFHYQFCAGEFRKESLTAIILYSLTRDNATDYMPEFMRYRLFNGENNPIMRAQRYLESRVPAAKPHILLISLFEMAFMQNRTLSPVLRGKIHDALLSRPLMTTPEDGSKHLKLDDNMTFDDQLLVNAMSISLYADFDDYKTASDMARYVVSQIQNHPFYDTILDAVFRTEAWLKVDCLFRKKFGVDKFDITIDVSADNGDKQQFKIDSKNMDITQLFNFTLPVNQITYSIKGFGIAAIAFIEVCSLKKPESMGSMPFQLTHEFKPMPYFSEINARTCMIYKPSAKDLQMVTEKFNRTAVIEIELPSGMRINQRQIGFFLSRTPEVMYFTYEPFGNKLIFFMNVPSTMFGKQMCFDWCLERLSSVIAWAPIQIRVYDYLQQENQLVQLIPIEFQPALLGYSFVDAVHKARPTLETLSRIQKPKEL